MSAPNTKAMEFQDKRRQLLKFLPNLQCHICEDVPGPSDARKKRYSCVDGSHVLCGNHKGKCSCGSLIPKNPLPIIDQLLQDLPWMCQNYKRGCQEIRMDVEELEHHQGECIFRIVSCPDLYLDCDDESVVFKDLADHLITHHKNDFEWKMAEGKKNEWVALKHFEDGDLDDCNTWSSRKVTSTDGDIFYESSCIENNAFHLVIYLLGSPDEAKKFTCRISVTNKKGEKFIYIGPIHTFNETIDDINATESSFRIGIDVVKRSLDKENKLYVEISIRNLKEEVKDDDEESGVSDG